MLKLGSSVNLLTQAEQLVLKSNILALVTKQNKRAKIADLQKIHLTIFFQKSSVAVTMQERVLGVGVWASLKC